MNPSAAFHCKTLPDNYPEHIVRMKRALRARIGDVQSLFAEVSAFIEQEIASIDAHGGHAWPELDYEQIAAGRVSAEQRAAIHRRGCVVVRGHFARDTVSAWDQDLLGYLAQNDFERIYRGPVDRFSATWKPRGRRFSRSTGRGRRCSCASMSAWPGCRVFSIGCGRASPRTGNGSTLR